MAKNQGLNGFWGAFWYGLRSQFTSSTVDDEHVTGFGGLFGRWLGKQIKNLFDGAGGGILDKIEDYNPTPAELTVINPIKTQLNNWLIERTNSIDALLAANNTSSFFTAVNNTIVQLQLIKNYYATKPLTSISANAQDYLSAQIDIVLVSYKATIVSLLEGNNIPYDILEGYLVKQGGDVIPTLIAIPNGFQTLGFKYDFPNGTSTISTSIPLNPTVLVQQQSTNPSSSSSGTGVQPSANNTTSKISPLKVIGFAVIAFFGLKYAFSDSKKTTKRVLEKK